MVSFIRSLVLQLSMNTDMQLHIKTWCHQCPKWKGNFGNLTRNTAGLEANTRLSVGDNTWWSTVLSSVCKYVCPLHAVSYKYVFKICIYIYMAHTWRHNIVRGCYYGNSPVRYVSRIATCTQYMCIRHIRMFG